MLKLANNWKHDEKEADRIKETDLVEDHLEPSKSDKTHCALPP